MADEYMREIAKKTCLHMIANYGFEYTTEDCVEVLVDIMEEFCGEMTTTAQAFAHNQNRTDINVYDMKGALKMRGYPYEELEYFKRENVMKPMNLKIPKVPADAKISKPKSFKELNIVPPKHIPDYLPSFPPEHTYKHTTSFPQIKDETEETYRKEKEMTLATEKALVNLEQSKEEVDNKILDIDEFKQIDNETKKITELHFNTLPMQEIDKPIEKRKTKEKDWRTFVSQKPYEALKASTFGKMVGISLLGEGARLDYPFGDDDDKLTSKEGGIFIDRKRKKNKSKKDFPNATKLVSKDKGNSGTKLNIHTKKKNKDDTSENTLKVKFTFPDKNKKARLDETMESQMPTTSAPEIVEIE